MKRYFVSKELNKYIKKCLGGEEILQYIQIEVEKNNFKNNDVIKIVSDEEKEEYYLEYKNKQIKSSYIDKKLNGIKLILNTVVDDITKKEIGICLGVFK